MLAIEQQIYIYIDHGVNFYDDYNINIIVIKFKMGNQNSGGHNQTRVRYRTVDSQRRQYHEDTSRNSFDLQNKRNQSFVTPPINSIKNSFASIDKQPIVFESVSKNKRTVQYSDNESSRRDTPIRVDNDRILDSLSKKNQQLRAQLKQINDQLTIQLNKKKLVPKKKKEHDKEEVFNNQTLQKQNIGLKRELENGYKQIEMYKRTIENLRGREEGDVSEYRLKIMEGNLADMDKEIQRYIKRIQGVKKIKNKQDHQIEKDINDDLKEGVQTYKHEAQALKKMIKEYAARDRMREGNYKKQQAYLLDLQKKRSQLNNEYYPTLNGHAYRKQSYQKTAASDKERVNPKEFRQVEEQAKMLRAKHEEYYRKIDALLKAKNKAVDDQNWIRQEIVYKERIIQALKNKMSGFRNLTKPRKNGLFGYDSNGSNANLSEYEDTPSEVQRQLLEQLNQDQFDIKHLIANIPKPIRKRPQQTSNGYSSDGDSSKNQGRRGKGMIITNQKAQPKKWGAVSTRTVEKGKHFRQEISFEDRAHFEGQIQPLIVGINLWVDKNNVILAIQSIYLNKGEIRYGAKSAQTVGTVTKRFDLQSPDYLKNISMTIGEEGFVESMTFYSKEGKVGKFGNKRSSDQSINFGLSSNQRPFLFLGATTIYETQPRINVFGLEICQQ